jgi:gliding motility-associated-like protein
VHINLPGYINYNWSTGSTDGYIDIIKTGTYRVIVTDRNGCVGSDSVSISYFNCATVYIPNAFTPDGNKLNDVFKPIFPAPVSNYHLQIFNRLGNRVFESAKSGMGWDGKFQSADQPTGVYVYIITFTDIDGINEKRTGTITLLR